MRTVALFTLCVVLEGNAVAQPMPESSFVWPSPRLTWMTPADELLMAELAIETGRFAEAEFILERLQETYPNWPGPRIASARLHAAKGDVEQAKQILVAELDSGVPLNPRSALKRQIRLLDNQQKTRFNNYVQYSMDNNIGNVPTDSVIEVFGLPFEIAPESRPKSGGALLAQSQFDVLVAGENRFFLRANTAVGLSEGTVDNSQLKVGLLHHLDDDDNSTHVELSWAQYFSEHRKPIQGVSFYTSRFAAIDRRTHYYGRIGVDVLEGRDDASPSAAFYWAQAGLVREIYSDVSLKLGLAIQGAGREFGHSDQLSSGPTLGVDLRIGDDWLLSVAAEEMSGESSYTEAFFGVSEKYVERRASLRVGYEGIIKFGFSPFVEVGAVEKEGSVAAREFDKGFLNFGMMRSF
jgi:hypothetical protein